MPLTQLSTFRQELRHPRFRQPSLALLLQPFPRLRDDLLDAWFEEPQCLDFGWMDDGWKKKTYEHIWTHIMKTYETWRTCIKSMVHVQAPQETKISPEDLAQWASTPEAMLLGDDGRKWPWSTSISIVKSKLVLCVWFCKQIVSNIIIIMLLIHK